MPKSISLRSRLVRVLAAFAAAVLLSCLLSAPAEAANCNVASGQGGTGPANWQTYCWLDLAAYNDTTARTTAGQNFSYALPDGTTMTFNMRVTNSGPGLTAAASPSWTGAAVGNTAFLGIAGRPILYQTGNGGTSVVTIRNITLTPPPGSSAITAYMFVAADAESSNDGEKLSFQTNGDPWQLLDEVGPTSGNLYPAISGAGTSTFTETGVAGTVGAYIVGSTTPTQVVTTMVGSGLQGAMFAVRFASIRLNMQIGGTRIDAADQFKFDITANAGGLLATGTSSGAGLGPFTAASLTTASALPITLSQAMASGSTNAISHYRSVLTCTNSSVSSTPLPNGVVTTAYNFGALQFGDNVQCYFTATPYPHISLTKTLGTGGRRFASDQFTLNIRDGETMLATTTTTGTLSTVNNGTISKAQGSAGTTYIIEEVGAGSTALEQYTATITCTNANGSSTTVLPTAPGGTLAAQLGDVVSCTIRNTRRGSNATLVVTKSSQVLSDPVNGTANPFALPGAIVRFTLEVANTGNTRVDNNTVVLFDALPANLEVGTAASLAFAQGTPTSALTFNAATNVRFSNSASPPASFAACTYTPVAPYDPAVRYVCLNPRGRMAARVSGSDSPSFSISFEARMK